MLDELARFQRNRLADLAADIIFVRTKETAVIPTARCIGRIAIEFPLMNQLSPGNVNCARSIALCNQPSVQIGEKAIVVFRL